MNYSMIFNIIGKILAVESAFMVPAMIISLFCGETGSASAFALTIAAGLVIGVCLALIKPGRKDLFAREGFVAVGLAWIFVSLLGAMPFVISGSIPSFVDAFFETVSGFTTTGSTILADVEALPRGMLYWRSFTHWLGGMGVLVFVLALSPLAAKDSGESMHLLRAESPGIKISKLVPRMRNSAGILYTIYIIMTIAEIILLLLDSVPAFDAVTLSLGTAGTGGFAIKNDSLASYSAYTQWVVTIFMILFGVNFNVYFLLLIREARRAFKSQELRVYLGIIVISTAAISVNIFGYFDTLGDTVRHAAFQVASIISTTGYATTDFDLWPQLSRTILVALMVVGGCAGSTGGGAKVIRIVVMFKSAARSVHQALHPNAVRLIHMDGEVLEDETAESVNSYMSMYFLILAGATLLISVDGLSFETNFTAALACLSNIGPGMDAVGATCNFSVFSAFSKLILSVTMLIGRLEIYPILMLFMPQVWRK